jgi:hypothetical protein
MDTKDTMNTKEDTTGLSDIETAAGRRPIGPAW